MPSDHLTNDEDDFYGSEYPPLMPKKQSPQKVEPKGKPVASSKKSSVSTSTTVWKLRVPAANTAATSPASQSTSTSRGPTPSTPASTPPEGSTLKTPVYFKAAKHVLHDYTINGCDVVGPTAMQVADQLKAAHRKDKGTLELVCGTQSITFPRAMLCVHSPLVLQSCVDDLTRIESSSYEIKDVQVPKSILESYGLWIESGWIPDIAQPENNIAASSRALMAASVETRRLSALKDLCGLFKLGDLLQDLRLMNTIATAIMKNTEFLSLSALSRGLTLARYLKRGTGSNNLISVLLYAQAVTEARACQDNPTQPPALLVDVEGSELCSPGSSSAPTIQEKTACDFHDHKNLFLEIRATIIPADGPMPSHGLQNVKRWSDYPEEGHPTKGEPSWW